MTTVDTIHHYYVKGLLVIVSLCDTLIYQHVICMWRV